MPLNARLRLFVTFLFICISVLRFAVNLGASGEIEGSKEEVKLPNVFPDFRKGAYWPINPSLLFGNMNVASTNLGPLFTWYAGIPSGEGTDIPLGLAASGT